MTPFRILALSACLALSVVSVVQAELIKTRDDDPAMRAARSEARRFLPLFLEQAKNADLSKGGFDVKWAKDTMGQEVDIEHIWVHVTAIEKKRVHGVLANEPLHFPGAEGDQVTFPLRQVTDWMITQPDGKLQGGWTLRVLLPQLSAEDQAYYASALLPLPK